MNGKNVETSSADEAKEQVNPPAPTAPVDAGIGPSKHTTENLNFMLVRIIDARSPFPLLALFKLAALPKEGDLINVQTSTGNLVGYKVQFVNFNPFQEYQVTIGCLPPDATSAFASIGNAELKERMDNIVKYNIQVFERAQAYSNAMILAGYAGIFGLWSFTRDILDKYIINIVAILVGISLIIYVTWEIYGMIIRANAAFKFQKLVGKNPAEFFRLLAEYEAEQRIISAKAAINWKITVIPAIIFAYAGALLLIYNFGASLIGLRLWP